MGVDQAGQDCLARDVDHLRGGRDIHLIRGTNLIDSAPVDDDDGIG